MKNSAHINYKLLLAIVGLLIFSATELFTQKYMFITTNSNEARQNFIKGRDLFEKLNFQEAIDYFNEAIQTDPDIALAYLYCSMAEKNGTGFSEKYLNEAIGLKNNVTEGEREMILFAQATYENNALAANKHINNLIKLKPEDERVQTWAGIYYFRNQDYKKANTHLNKAYRLNNNYHPAVNSLGYNYMHMNKINKAEKMFKKYMALLPGYANPYDSYGEFLLWQGKFGESIVNYQKALDYNPENASSYKGLGDNYLFTGDFELARKNYQKYYDNVINDNQKFHALALEASVDLHENKPDKAMKSLDKYIELAETLDKPFYKIYGNAYKGYVLTETGRPSEGLKYYQTAMDLVDTEKLSAQIRENLRTTAYMWKYYALTANDDLKDAETVRTQCRQRVSEETNRNQWKMYNALCGMMEIKKANYDKAKTHLEESFDNPFTWYYTGLMWEKTGNERKAQKYYKKVANHYNNSFELGTLRQKAIAGLKK